MTKVLTMLDVNSVSAAPVIRFLIWIGSPVRGSTALKSMPDIAQDTTQTTNISSRNRTAGSGSLLPSRSTTSRERATQPRGAAISGVAGVMRVPGGGLAWPES